MIAMYASIAAYIGALAMLILGLLGLRHATKARTVPTPAGRRSPRTSDPPPSRPDLRGRHRGPHAPTPSLQRGADRIE